ncbi:hypothetical protein LA080_013782 [Diaporthe eres]|nr:hypothetical protein LA080_013782 [Diaporthe eres]
MPIKDFIMRVLPVLKADGSYFSFTGITGRQFNLCLRIHIAQYGVAHSTVVARSARRGIPATSRRESHKCGDSFSFNSTRPSAAGPQCSFQTRLPMADCLISWQRPSPGERLNHFQLHVWRHEGGTIYRRGVADIRRARHRGKVTDTVDMGKVTPPPDFG